MQSARVDVWFGSGALKGVFGAGVAHALQNAFDGRTIDPSLLRLYGSSVGCLTAVYLATGHAECGLSIFRDETRTLITRANLLPAVGARVVNGLTRAARLGGSPVRVPGVLDVDHVFDVMTRRTPEIVTELRAAPMPVYAETVHRKGRVKHRELRSAKDPLKEIGRSLNLFPFTDCLDVGFLDSAIHGYGFAELMRTMSSPLIVVLNEAISPSKWAVIGDVLCAALSGHRRVPQLYWNRRHNRIAALQLARQRAGDVLIVAPSKPLRLRRASDFVLAHDMGRRAAESVVHFIRQSAGNAVQPAQTLMVR